MPFGARPGAGAVLMAGGEVVADGIAAGAAFSWPACGSAGAWLLVHPGATDSASRTTAARQKMGTLTLTVTH